MCKFMAVMAIVGIMGCSSPTPIGNNTKHPMEDGKPFVTVTTNQTTGVVTTNVFNLGGAK